MTENEALNPSVWTRNEAGTPVPVNEIRSSVAIVEPTSPGRRRYLSASVQLERTGEETDRQYLLEVIDDIMRDDSIQANWKIAMCLNLLDRLWVTG